MVDFCAISGRFYLSIGYFVNAHYGDTCRQVFRIYRVNLFLTIHLLSALISIHFTTMNMEIALPLTGVQNPSILTIHQENQDHSMVCAQANPKH